MLSILCLIAAGICDLFDGYVARKINVHNSAIGKELDSLIDVVSFGILPVFILINLGGNIIIDTLITLIYVSCAIWRLAVFNTLPSEKKYFMGIPVTFVSLFLPLILISYFFLGLQIVVWITRASMVLLAFLFVSKIKFKKPKGIFYIIYVTIGILLIILWSRFYIKSI